MQDVEPSPAEERKRRGKGKKTRKGKTSAAAHAGKETRGKLTHDVCHCGAWNCDGKMWNLAKDESDSSSPLAI